MFTATIKNNIYKKVVRFMTGTDRKPKWNSMVGHDVRMSNQLKFISNRIQRLREDMEYAESRRDREIQELVSTKECTCVHSKDTLVVSGMGHQWECEKMKIYHAAIDNGAHYFKLHVSKPEFQELQRMLDLIEELHALATDGYNNLD
jgi:hypothetical protein